MLVALVPFGSPEWKLNNLGDLNVDRAFQLALPYFLEQHFQFGEQVVFTYGPWGILLSTFTGSTFQLAALLFRIALVCCVFMALCTLAGRSRDPAGRTIAWGGAIALVLLWIMGHRDSYFLVPALLVAYQGWTPAIIAHESVALRGRRAEHLLWIALSLLSGWAALAKFNIFVVSNVAFLLILIGDLKRRRWPVLPFAFAIALLFAWLGAGQSLANLPLWVLRCLDLSNGYADAMAKGFFIPYSMGVVVIYYGAVTLIIFAAIAAAGLYRWKLPALLSLLFILFVCAVSIKHGMGGNQVEQSLAVLFTLLWFVGQLLVIPIVGGSVEREQYRWRRFGRTTALAGLLCLTVVGVKTNFPIVSPLQALDEIRSNVSLLKNTLHGVSTDKWNATLTGLHRFWIPPIMPTGQTIDVYPQQTGLVIGREGLRYSPRPAFLSLNAHTFRLANTNANHLEGVHAPDLVLFQVLPHNQAENNRHPALADGPSWPILLSRYDLISLSGQFLTLRKRVDTLQPLRRLIVERKVALNEQVPLPHVGSGLVWAEIEIKRTFFGKLLHTVYKSPHMLITSKTTDSIEHTHQIVPELGAAGFLISPLIESTLSFAQIQRRDIPTRAVVQSIKLSSPDAPRSFWAEDVTLRLFELSLPTSTLPDLSSDDQRVMSLQSLAGNSSNCLFLPQFKQQDRTGEKVLTFHAPCETEISVSPNDKKMTLKYGLEDSSYIGAIRTDGVIVQITALTSNGKEYRSWFRTLNLATNLDDRGLQQMTISWQAAAVGKLVIKMLPGVNNDPSYDHSYIQDVVFAN